MSKDSKNQSWGTEAAESELAHGNDNMECYSCHQSWTTSCGGCHLPIEANWKADSKHYEGGRPEIMRRIIPRSHETRYLCLDAAEKSTVAESHRFDLVRPWCCLPLIRAGNVFTSSNHRSQQVAIVPRLLIRTFSHTVRKTETRVCSDCHLAEESDNNAIMAQTLGYGTDFIDFMGFHAWVGTDGSVDAVQVTEWSEPQAVIGSYLQKIVYPDFFEEHVERELELKIGHRHRSGEVNCLQLRGEYLFAAAGDKGMVVYDVAGIGNKGISQKIITSPASKLGQSTRIKSANATCLSMITTQPIAPERNTGKLMREVNQEKPTHPIYNYVAITDSLEGLILTDVGTLSDGEPRNNFLKRALTWNVDGVLDGARDIEVGGRYAYIVANAGLVVLDMDTPLAPSLVATVPLNNGHDVIQQFRFLFVTDDDGLKTIDITDVSKPRLLDGNTIALADANRVFVARTFAYVAAGSDGLVIVDVSDPTQLKEYQRFNDGIE